MADTISTTHNGVTITYQESYARWYAEKGDRTFYDANLAELKKKLDRSTKAKAERLKVLYVMRNRNATFCDAEITSYDGHKPRISYKNGNAVERNVVYDSDVADDTEANRAILAEMAPLCEQRNAIATKLHDLERKITRTVVRAHAERTRKMMAGEEV